MTEGSIYRDRPLWRCPRCEHVQNVDDPHASCSSCGLAYAERFHPDAFAEPEPEPESPMTVEQAENVGRALAGVARDLAETTRQLAQARSRCAILEEENRQLRVLASLPGDRDALAALGYIVVHARAVMQAANRLVGMGWEARDLEGHDDGA